MTFDYYELDDGTLEIEGYDNEDKAKIVEIPDTIDEKKVSVLNRYLFSNEVDYTAGKFKNNRRSSFLWCNCIEKIRD